MFCIGEEGTTKRQERILSIAPKQDYGGTRPKKIAFASRWGWYGRFHKAIVMLY